MKRIVLLSLTAALLVLPCGFAHSGEWTSNIPATQRVGPKYGDQLKKGKVPVLPKGQGSKLGKKKDSGS